MSDVDISKVQNIDKLRGQYCWIYDFDEFYSDKEKIEKEYQHQKDWYGFNLREMLMEVKFENGYYIAEFLTELPLDSIVYVYKDRYNPKGIKKTLKEAIINFLEVQLMDGIGENPIGEVNYNYTTHEVYLGNYKEI